MTQKTFRSPKSTATKKLKSWRPPANPLSKEEQQAYVQLAVEAVFSVWNQQGRPAHLSDIFPIVRQKVKEHLEAGTWPYKQYRGKRSVDRCVNYAATDEYGGKIVAVTAGIYQPTPELFDEKKKDEIEWKEYT